MNGEHAQIIALVAHGNHALNGGSVDVSANSTFQFVSGLKFSRYRSPQDSRGLEVAGSAAEWLDFLRANRAARLWNVAFGWQRQDFAEHIAASFSGGVPRAIQADMPDGYELWYPQWKTGGQDPQKPWLVEYRSLRFSNSHALPVPALELVKDRLRQAILQAQAFAGRPDLGIGLWAAHFARAVEWLDSPAPVGPYHPDLLPGLGYSLEARQVLAAAAQADVFGGMGSWNDLGFADAATQDAYEEVTKTLYDAVKYATVMASNAFDPSLR